MKRSATIWTVAIAGVIVLVLYLVTLSAGDPVIVDVEVPTFSAVAIDGEVLFAQNCAACHGTNAAGSDVGPPLVHSIYRPSHHADEAFLLAALRGVRAHHWGFGDMPPQPQIGDEDIAMIVQYVRELQLANGI
ncbi:MAG: c-type cytochrome [Alphaproteobacteria bacterium]